MATVDTVKTALVNKLETSIASSTPEQLAYIAKAVNSIEPPIAWESKDSNFTATNYRGYFINTTINHKKLAVQRLLCQAQTDPLIQLFKQMGQVIFLLQHQLLLQVVYLTMIIV
jgi:hypothetical protein